MRSSNNRSAVRNNEHFDGNAAILQEKIDRGELTAGEILMDVDLANCSPAVARVVGNWLLKMAEQPKTFYRLDAYRMKSPAADPPSATWRSYRMVPDKETLSTSTSIWLSKEGLQNWLSAKDAEAVESQYLPKRRAAEKLAKAIAKETALFEKLLSSGLFAPEEDAKKRLKDAELAASEASSSLVDLVGFITEISKLLQNSILVVSDDTVSAETKIDRLTSLCNTQIAVNGEVGGIGGIPAPACLQPYMAGGCRRAVTMTSAAMHVMHHATNALENARQEIASTEAELKKLHAVKESFLQELKTRTPQELAAERAHQKNLHAKGKRNK